MRPLTKVMRLRVRILGVSLAVQGGVHRLNLWLAAPIVARGAEAPEVHRCHFDSRRGIFIGRAFFLRCPCGAWTEAGLGHTRRLDEAETPHPCRLLSQMHNASRQVCNCIIALAVGVLLALIICPEVILR